MNYLSCLSASGFKLFEQLRLIAESAAVNLILLQSDDMPKKTKDL